jgi:hypothetical protein
MHDLDKEIERVKKEMNRATLSSSSDASKMKSTSTYSNANPKPPQYIIKEKTSAKKPELIQPVMEKIDAELNKLEQSGLIEKMDLQSIELINRSYQNSQIQNVESLKLIEEFLSTSSLTDTYQKMYKQQQTLSQPSQASVQQHQQYNHFQQQDTSSIIPQSHSIQNNGHGLAVPNYVNNNLNIELNELINNANSISRNTITTKLQDLIIPSPNIKYHMI